MPTVVSVQIARRPADELALLLRAKKRRQAAEQAQEQGQRLLGDLLGKQARGARDHDRRGDRLRRQAMVEPRGRRLNPLQPAAPHDLRPRHRHFGVAAEDVGVEQFRGDPLLPSIDHFVAGRGGANLLQVTRLDGVAKDDSHGPGATGSQKLAGFAVPMVPSSSRPRSR